MSNLVPHKPKSGGQLGPYDPRPKPIAPYDPPPQAEPVDAEFRPVEPQDNIPQPKLSFFGSLPPLVRRGLISFAIFAPFFGVFVLIDPASNWSSWVVGTGVSTILGAIASKNYKWRK